MYVTQNDQPKTHLGMFTFKDQTKWKYQPLDLCDAGGIKSSTAYSTFTHATPDRVALSENVTFVWKSISEDLNLDSLIVHAVVASNDPETIGKPRWQEVQLAGIPKYTAPAPTATYTAPVATYTAPVAHYSAPVATYPAPVATEEAQRLTDTLATSSMKKAYEDKLNSFILCLMTYLI